MGEKFTWKKELEWWNIKKQSAKMHDNIKTFISTVFETMTVYEQFNPGKADKLFNRTLLDNSWANREYSL